MPHAGLKLVPGVDTQETHVLNEEAGISISNYIRFFVDRNGLALVQPIGGWTPYVPNPFNPVSYGVIRALWAWENLNVKSWLAVGTDVFAGNGASNLVVIQNDNPALGVDITPQIVVVDYIAPNINAKIGSSYFNITGTFGPTVTNYDSIFLATPVSIAGVVLFGLYPCNPDNFSSTTSYDIQALDQLGNPEFANATTSLAVLPQFTTTAGTQVVNVYLPSYPYLVGTTFAVLTPTNVGGITLSGNYVVQTVVDANNFTIAAANTPTLNDSKPLNSGNLGIIFNYGNVTPGSSPFTAFNVAATDWFMDNYGQILITCPVQTANTYQIPYQPIYQWTPGQLNATVISQAPSYSAGFFVAMPQRQIVAWGTTQTGVPDPLLIRWCDIGNFTNWTDLVTNQAGAYRIPTGSKIVSAIQGPQQGIIWTDVDVWAMQYTGPPYVYGFNKIGTGCGLIARKACGSAGGVIYWMGFNQFYTLDGNGIQVLPCSIWDKVFQNLNTAYVQNIRIAINSLFNEVWWFYPSAASSNGENDSYVKINTELGTWNYGTLARSAWIDQSVLGRPIAAEPSTGYIYQHETSDFANGAIIPATFSTGYFAQADGDYKIFVDWIWPDMKWGQLNEGTPGPASVQISFYVKDYPSDTPQVFGPYTVTQATEYFYTRFRGRLMQVQISSGNGYFWRLGLIRYRYSIDGKI